MRLEPVPVEERGAWGRQVETWVDVVDVRPAEIRSSREFRRFFRRYRRALGLGPCSQRRFLAQVRRRYAR